MASAAPPPPGVVNANNALALLMDAARALRLPVLSAAAPSNSEAGLARSIIDALRARNAQAAARTAAVPPRLPSAGQGSPPGPLAAALHARAAALSGGAPFSHPPLRPSPPRPLSAFRAPVRRAGGEGEGDVPPSALTAAAEALSAWAGQDGDASLALGASSIALAGRTAPTTRHSSPSTGARALAFAAQAGGEAGAAESVARAAAALARGSVREGTGRDAAVVRAAIGVHAVATRAANGVGGVRGAPPPPYLSTRYDVGAGGGLVSPSSSPSPHPRVRLELPHLAGGEGSIEVSEETFAALVEQAAARVVAEGVVSWGGPTQWASSFAQALAALGPALPPPPPYGTLLPPLLPPFASPPLSNLGASILADDEEEEEEMLEARRRRAIVLREGRGRGRSDAGPSPPPPPAPAPAPRPAHAPVNLQARPAWNDGKRPARQPSAGRGKKMHQAPAHEEAAVAAPAPVKAASAAHPPVRQAASMPRGKTLLAARRARARGGSTKSSALPSPPPVPSLQHDFARRLDAILRPTIMAAGRGEGVATPAQWSTLMDGASPPPPLPAHAPGDALTLAQKALAAIGAILGPPPPPPTAPASVAAVAVVAPAPAPVLQAAAVVATAPVAPATPVAPAAEGEGKKSKKAKKERVEEAVDPYESMGREELRGACTSRGLEAGGKKEELRERLRAADGK
jgi:hypothetical protein